MRCEQIETLLSGYVDAQLTQQQRQMVHVHLADCPACRDEVKSLQRIREDLQMMRVPDPSADQMEKLARGLFERGFSGLGWFLGIVGAAILIGYAVYEFLTEPAADAVVKVAVMCVLAGCVFLLGGKAAERTREYRSDRYKDVQR